MVNCVIFSKDRPMQLDATLRSIKINAQGFFDSIKVIFKPTNEFEIGYDIVKMEHPDVFFIREQNFREDVDFMLRGDFTCFLLDDDIIFRKILFRKEILNLFSDPALSCFSFRLGLNIDYCYSRNEPNVLSSFQDREEFIRWEWRKEQWDFGYPISLTSHLFRTKDLKRWTNGLDFKNPNEYEDRLQARLNEVPPIMMAYKKSRILGVPINLVNETHHNRHGLSNFHSPIDLNKRFLLGQRIKLNIDSNIHAAQTEIAFSFI